MMQNHKYFNDFDHCSVTIHVRVLSLARVWSIKIPFARMKAKIRGCELTWLDFVRDQQWNPYVLKFEEKWICDPKRPSPCYPKRPCVTLSPYKLHGHDQNLTLSLTRVTNSKSHELFWFKILSLIRKKLLAPVRDIPYFSLSFPIFSYDMSCINFAAHSINQQSEAWSVTLLTIIILSRVCHYIIWRRWSLSWNGLCQVQSTTALMVSINWTIARLDVLKGWQEWWIATTNQISMDSDTDAFSPYRVRSKLTSRVRQKRRFRAIICCVAFR